MLKENYEQMHRRIQAEVNALPMYWAFSDEQWKKLLSELGLTEEEAKEQLVSGIGNAIYRKSDAQHIHDTFNRQAAELSAAMEDMEFLEDAFYYEMCNHEYAINMQGKYDVLDCLGFDVEYENEMACLTDDQKKAWKNARNRYYKEANEKGWY